MTPDEWIFIHNTVLTSKICTNNLVLPNIPFFILLLYNYSMIFAPNQVCTWGDIECMKTKDWWKRWHDSDVFSDE